MDTELKDEFREMIIGMKTFLELQTRHVERLESLLAHHAPIEGQALPVQSLGPHLDKTIRGSNSGHCLTEETGQATPSSSLEVTSQGNSSHPNEADKSHDDGSVTEHLRPTTSLSVKSATVDILLNGKPIENLVSEDDVKTLFYSSPKVGTVPFRSAEISPHPSPVSARPEPDSRVVGWSYWRPQFNNNMYSSGRGRPNYIAEWELTRIDDKWYHIDNPSEPLANFDGDFPAERYVPYSHSPPALKEKLATVGLDDAATKRIQEVLGRLPSVPPDSRVLFTFERNQLRLAHGENRLEEYLTGVNALLQELASTGGHFQVVDFDDFMNHATYSHQYKTPSSGISDMSQGGLLLHCLNAEEFRLDIPPARFQIHLDRPIHRLNSGVVRQWHRLVYFRGLGQMRPDGILKSALEAKSSRTIWERVIRSSVSDVWAGIPYRVLDTLFDLHIFCRRHRSRSPYSFDWNPFHITWYRIIAADDMSQTIWKSGTLYHSGKYIQQAAFTAGLFPQRENEVRCSPYFSKSSFLEENVANQFYWTMMLLIPPRMSPRIVGVHMHIPIHAWFLYSIAAALANAADSWDEIAIIMEDILDEGDVILNSQKHDGLLFDDGTFSRSRRYFWAVDSLDTFHASVSNTLDQWNMWWEAWEPIIRNCEIVHTARIAARRRRDPVPGDEGDTDNAGAKSISLPLEGINKEICRLEGLKDTFQTRLQKTQTLREALFSASSVMESREATDLGKTVKLLTYVSIFYLPLGVCAGMFSINPDFGLTLFGIVTLVTAVTTYFLVANLENILSVLRKTPHPIRKPFVDKMAQDVDEEWKRKGRDLKDAPPERVDTTPSEWRIIQYAGIRLARVFGRFTRRREAPEDELP